MHIKNLYENIGDKESLKDLDDVPREIVRPNLDFLCVLNIWISKTENPFSLKDDEREMTRKTKPMSTTKLTNPHDIFGNPTKGLWHTLITILTTFDNNSDNP